MTILLSSQFMQFSIEDNNRYYSQTIVHFLLSIILHRPTYRPTQCACLYVMRELSIYLIAIISTKTTAEDADDDDAGQSSAFYFHQLECREIVVFRVLAII